jgi:CspA family cold shock protein
MMGTVKWFNDRKGLGFIQTEDGRDILVHFTAIEGKNKSLEEGDRVEFKIIEGPKGPVATRVRKVPY